MVFFPAALLQSALRITELQLYRTDSSMTYKIAKAQRGSGRSRLCPPRRIDIPARESSCPVRTRHRRLLRRMSQLQVIIALLSARIHSPMSTAAETSTAPAPTATGTPSE